MNEPKRRGRPPKAKPEELMQALADVEAKSKDPTKGNEVYEHVHSRSDARDIAQAYALRIWRGGLGAASERGLFVGVELEAVDDGEVSDGKESEHLARSAILSDV